MEAFLRYPWPGNIRELENLVERACILETSSILTPTSFPAELFTGAPSALSAPCRENRPHAGGGARDCRHGGGEKLSPGAPCPDRGRINRTAESAGVTVRQISKLMRKYNIRKETFR